MGSGRCINCNLRLDSVNTSRVNDLRCAECQRILSCHITKGDIARFENKLHGLFPSRANILKRFLRIS